MSTTTELARKGAETAEATYEQLKEQVETLKNDVAAITALAASAREAGYETAREAVHGVRRAGRRAVKVAEDGYDYAENQLEEVMSDAGHFARERPVLALGLAAGAGFLLAFLLSRR